MSSLISSLGDVAEFINGAAFKPEDWGDDGTKIIRIQNLTDATKPYNRTNRIVSERIHVQPGDLLVSWSATLGVFEWRGPDVAYLNQHIFRVVPDERKVDKRYLRHGLELALLDMRKHLHGATMLHVNRGEFLSTKLYLPPLREQRRIASILDKADSLRIKRREVLVQLDHLMQATFVEMFGDPATNPKKWPVEQLGSICEVGSSKRVFVEELVDEGVPFYRGTEIGQLAAGEVVTPSLFISKEHYARLRAEGGVPTKGDLLLPSICPDGRIFTVDTDQPFYFKDARVLWIKVNPTRLSSAFLLHYLKLLFARNYSRIASGTTFAELKIFALKALEVYLPPIELQQRFAELAKSIELQQQTAKLSQGELVRFFEALEHQAFREGL